jgi:SpoVK/Ycf46/Vps4 family AAA+-type ATPase
LSNRLARAFHDDDGLRHVLLSGPAVGDLAFVDIATGALPFADALAHEAVKRGFDHVVSIDDRGSLSFVDPGRESRFLELTREQSRDPQSDGGRAASIGSGRSGSITRGGGGAEQARTLPPAGADALLAAIGLVERAQGRSSQRFFIHFTSLGRLLDPDLPNSDRAKQVFEAVGRLLAIGAGNSKSRLVVTVPDPVAGIARGLLQSDVRGAADWHPVDASLPEESEITSFLERLVDLHSLVGNLKAAARRLVRRRYSLSRISEAIRVGIERGERDLSLMLGSEPDADAIRRALDRLDALVGLEALKKDLRSLASQAAAMQRAASTDGLADPPALHMALLGRPGTGKTEVASILADLLHASGGCRRNTLVKATIADIVGPYNSGEAIANIRGLARSAAGGVLFIDEAYSLAENDWGRQALDVLIAEMEDRRGDLAVVLAGYPDRMQALFQANAGLQSRIPRIFRLPDYTPDELCEIFDRRVRAAAIAIDADATTSAHAVIRREATRPHSNARDVRNHFEQWNGARVASGAKRLERMHIVDPRTPDWKKAESLIAAYEARFSGIPEMRRWMESQLDMSRDAMGRGMLPRAPRVAFLGPPGTGKTESARHVGEFLRMCGVLRDGRVIETSMKDFVSPLVGGSIQQTLQRFRDASECVLFIDEIYMFAQDATGREILNQIVALLTDPEHASVAVVLAGYEDRMTEVYAANAGLKDRLAQSVRFGWPPSETLADIALAHLAKEHCRSPSEAERLALRQRLAALLESRRPLPDFAGARSAKLLADEVWKRSLRRKDGGVRCDDLPESTPTPKLSELAGAFLRTFPRSDSLVRPLQEIAARIRMQTDPRTSSGSASGIQLVGAPGTGKSTFARWVATNLLTRPDAAPAPSVECSAQSLQGTHLGEAQSNVRTAFERACGGLLFIDEFHALHAGGDRQNLFSTEIAREIVAQMTSARNARTVVVIAGYADRLQSALDLDPGLASRFPACIELPSPSDPELAAIAYDAILQKFGGESPVTLMTASPMLERYFARLRQRMGAGFGNCRCAVEVANKVYMQAMVRRDGDVPGQLELDDLLEGLEA